MPTISVDKRDLFHHIGKQMTDEQFDKLCFEFGIELDDIVETYTYKIEIPANRYDLLCVEGLGKAINVFLELGKVADFKVVEGKERLVIESSTEKIRKFCVAAILRDVQFDEKNYDSFIKLQDKLHQNICRKRTLVAIGTHDLDTLKGPFYYKALKPSDIKFCPLNKTKTMDANELMTVYEKEPHIKPYLGIIRDSSVYPVIYDSNGVVLSLPPIINGDHSKINLNTKNVLIECTATDLTKAKIVLDTMWRALQLKKDGHKEVYPQFEYRSFISKNSEITKMIGVPLTNEQCITYLNRMSLLSNLLPNGDIKVLIPPTRSDILHICDIMEDLAIAYGFNNIKRSLPLTNTIGKPQGINKLTDLLRREVAFCGFSEVLTLTLCSLEENFDFLLKRDSHKEAVKLSNPKTYEYQVVRSSLLPGLLKSLYSNIRSPLPIKLFEIADVVLKANGKTETGVPAINQRRLCAVFCSTTSGLETMHGLLDRIMTVLGVPFDAKTGYSTQSSDEPYYFPNRKASVHFKGEKIGSFGILHPQVLGNFEIPQVCSALELNIEPFE